MILTGFVWYNVNLTEGWTLASGSGERVFRSQDIQFNPPFQTPPAVALAISGIDSEKGLRLTLQAFDVEPGEFNIRLGTWAETAIYQVWITWIAFDGAAPS